MPNIGSSARQVALLIESSRAYGRGLLRGIAAYAQEHGHWSLRHQEMTISSDPPLWLSQWKGDGVIVRAETQNMIRAIQRLGIPAVDLRCRSSGIIPSIDTESASVVRLAVDHLRGRGYTRFGYCGFGEANYSDDRLIDMRRYVRELGFELVTYQSPVPEHPTIFEAEQSGMLDQEGLVGWINSLETPVGILACNDIRAQQLLSACDQSQRNVPDEVAVVGVDNDDVICPLCLPPLTSVEPNAHRIGYEAARMLERMMNGENQPAETVYVPARRIVIRKSTDSIPVDDEDFVKAYGYIRENACMGISVQEVADAVPMSRRALERRMRNYLGQSPADLISKIRLARIRELLETTSHSLKRIASLTGFQQDEHMAKFFKKLVGIPPGRYRTKYRKERENNDHELGSD